MEEEEEEGGEQGSRRSGCGAEGTTSREAKKKKKASAPFVSSTIGTVSWATGEPWVGGEGEDKRDGRGGALGERETRDGSTASAVSFTSKKNL